MTERLQMGNVGGKEKKDSVKAEGEVEGDAWACATGAESLQPPEFEPGDIPQASREGP